jgi:hypothetical protein
MIGGFEMELEIIDMGKCPKTFGDFMDEYEAEIDVLEIFDKDGCEIDADMEIPDDTPVLCFARKSGLFDVELDI